MTYFPYIYENPRKRFPCGDFHMGVDRVILIHFLAKVHYLLNP